MSSFTLALASKERIPRSPSYYTGFFISPETPIKPPLLFCTHGYWGIIIRGDLMLKLKKQTKKNIIRGEYGMQLFQSIDDNCSVCVIRANEAMLLCIPRTQIILTK